MPCCLSLRRGSHKSAQRLWRPFRPNTAEQILWLLAISLLLAGCGRQGGPVAKPVSPPATPATVSTQAPIREGPLFLHDVANSVGVGFRHHSPLTDQRHIHLVMGSGIGWLDFDRDGTPDLFCCQGATYDPTGPFPTPSAASRRPKQQPSNALFQNRGEGPFVEVAQSAGLSDEGYSMGMSAADFDNDGFVDLFITGYGENRLFHNCGDGYFTLVPIPAGTQADRLSASCAWGDIDNDGYLDLFVTNYAELSPSNYPLCTLTVDGRTVPISCHPRQLKAMTDLLYRNQGNGEFAEISKEAGIATGEPYQGLGVVAADLDLDGDTDFYVANDTTPNQLWENDGGGRFIDRGAESGTATNRHGMREASMGIAIGDVDGNGQFELFVTNYYNAVNTFYRNEGKLLFTDVTDEIGLGAPSRLRLGFGTNFVDLDNDGWLDTFVANGHVHDLLHEVHRDEPFAQLAQLFHNRQGAIFQDVSASSGPYFQVPHVGRGSAVADFDRDGDLDIAINHLNENASLLQNATKNEGRWLRLELVGVESNRGGVGAVIHLELEERTLVRTLCAGTSYLSCDEATMLIGLGACDEVRAVTVTWPSGRRERWESLGTNRDYRLVEATGRGVP